MSTEPTIPPPASPPRQLKTLVVVPIYNEESHVEELLEKFRPLAGANRVDEILFVDDGSTDRTSEILRRTPYVSVFRHPERRGCGASIRSGYRHALSHGFDVLVVMAGNGKDDPGQIPRLLEPIGQDRADYVQGSRFLGGGSSRGLPLHRLLAMRMLTWVFCLFLLRRFSDCTNGFRSYRTALLRDSRLDWDQPWLGNDYELEIYLHYKAASLGYRFVEVPVSKIYQRARDGSYSKARLANWFTGLKPLFYLRFGLRK
jgi:dolichol-phosphate mannosyltransferase